MADLLRSSGNKKTAILTTLRLLGCLSLGEVCCAVNRASLHTTGSVQLHPAPHNKDNTRRVYPLVLHYIYTYIYIVDEYNVAGVNFDPEAVLCSKILRGCPLPIPFGLPITHS